ncbi:rhodanese-like domain-containing protein [Gilliamella sp. WF3-4]|jgi:rhodanese-related sulfurtransferase|uniref:rhodanese-like domain-containing protein n=1 Tax=Gilliamella sp. WF3-4 TaxID=3120255 RepID=UPI00080E9684|nr:rhodanese-like domain-containing protein [Gilliamella apicola]OCG15002.1 hypothetical protein A9G47_12425 [Gilliamella apicola]
MSVCHSNLLYRLLFSCTVLSFCCQISANEINNCQEDIQNYRDLFTHLPINQHKESLDKTFWLTIEQARNLSDDVVWIDVRSNLFNSDNQLGILTIPLNHLEKKDFLYDKTVVLVGTGFEQQTINRTINTLRQKGYKHLFALLGGIRTWSKLKEQNLQLSNTITPEEFLLGSKTINWQIITIGLMPQDINTLPEKPIRNFNLSEESNLAIKHFFKNKIINNDTFIQYVLIPPNEHITKLLKRKLTFPESSEVVWLEGGLAGYQQYVKQQANLINNAGKSLSKPCRLTL